MQIAKSKPRLGAVQVYLELARANVLEAELISTRSAIRVAPFKQNYFSNIKLKFIGNPSFCAHPSHCFLQDFCNRFAVLCPLDRPTKGYIYDKLLGSPPLKWRSLLHKLTKNGVHDSIPKPSAHEEQEACSPNSVATLWVLALSYC